MTGLSRHRDHQAAAQRRSIISSFILTALIAAGPQTPFTMQDRGTGRTSNSGQLAEGHAASCSRHVPATYGSQIQALHFSLIAEARERRGLFKGSPTRGTAAR
ncbi:MAG: hypothetical protein P0Y64_09895 [Candidatus Sphingomonas colombiensis]|nr:hypothetical protein [Sphingomonas sp.]WEK41732.1 MAG: hypothetical protein P0Y64_09895 [Sphingomonas sp.]